MRLKGGRRRGSCDGGVSETDGEGDEDMNKDNGDDETDSGSNESWDGGGGIDDSLDVIIIR